MNRFKLYIEKVWPLFPAILFLVSFQIVVLIYLLILSLSSADISDSFPTFATYSTLFSDADFWSALHNTIIFVLVGTPLELLTGLVVALLFYRSFFLKNIIQSILLIPLAIPALVTAMLLYILFDYPGGHINHLLLGNYSPFPQLLAKPISWRAEPVTAMLLSLIGKVWRDMPISMLILLTGLNTIDSELIDAAKTMGATFRQRILKVIIPLIIPSIAVVLLLRSVEMWKEFIFPFVLAGRSRFLGTLIDYYYNGIGNSYSAAAVAIIMVICIILSSILINNIIQLIKKVLVAL